MITTTKNQDTENIFLLASACCLTLSCHWNDMRKQTSQGNATTKDTAHLIGLVKSYEPKLYKGKAPAPFYDNRGAFDFWRYPLAYPCSIRCIDVKDYGNIYSDTTKLVDEYFIFSFANGTSQSNKGLTGPGKRLKEIKYIGDTSFMSIKEYDQKL